MWSEIQSRIEVPFYISLRDNLLPRIKSGKLSEDAEWSSVVDSLDTVQLTMEIEELGFQPTVPIKSIRDLLWLFRALDLWREHREPKR